MLASLALAGPGPARAETVAGPASVIDGDRIAIRGEAIHLAGIDAPERGQTCADADGRRYPCGRAAETALAEKIVGRTLTCEAVAADRSFPTVARTIREDFAAELPADFEIRYRARLLERFEDELRPTQGVIEVLGRLSVPACVATSRAALRYAVEMSTNVPSPASFVSSVVPTAPMPQPTSSTVVPGVRGSRLSTMLRCRPFRPLRRHAFSSWPTV